MKFRLFMLFLITVSCRLCSNASAADLDPQLQATLSRYLRSIGDDISRIDNRSADQDGKLNSVLRLLEQLSESRVSPCELGSELDAKRPHDLKRVVYLLQDLRESKERQIETALKLISERLDIQETASSADRKTLRELAVKVASTSTSLSEMREEILPEMFSFEVEAKLKRVTELSDKVDFLDLELRRKVESICDRLAEMNDRLSRLEGRQLGSGVVQAGYDERYGMSIMDEPRTNERVRPIRAIERSRLQTVNRTAWEPEAYASTKELCSNPSPGPQNVYFDTQVLTNGVWRRTRHFGDMYQDCSGRIVMVIRKSL